MLLECESVCNCVQWSGNTYMLHQDVQVQRQNEKVTVTTHGGEELLTGSGVSVFKATSLGWTLENRLHPPLREMSLSLNLSVKNGSSRCSFPEQQKSDKKGQSYKM